MVGAAEAVWGAEGVAVGEESPHAPAPTVRATTTPARETLRLKRHMVHSSSNSYLSRSRLAMRHSQGTFPNTGPCECAPGKWRRYAVDMSEADR